MVRRILSIITITLLLFTISTPLTGSIFTFADEETLTDNQKSEIATATYYNYRKGWFTGSSPATVIGVLNSYVNLFFSDSANNTTIKSFQDFSEHITVDKKNGHWAVSIDNEGIQFLDRLSLWLLGKNKFPNLYSGGSWGSGPTVDQVYDGYNLDGNNVYFVNNTNVNFRNYYNYSDVTPGTNVYLCGERFYNLYKNKYNNFDPANGSGNGYGVDSIYPETGTLPVQFSANYTYNLSFRGTYKTKDTDSANDFLPRITGYGWAPESTDAGRCAACLYCENGIKSVRGNFGLVVFRGSSTIYYCNIAYNYTDNKYAFYRLGTSNVSAGSSNSVNSSFVTDDFDQNNLANQDGETGNTFIPQTNEGGNTYNYYEGDSINNFYNNYMNDYRRQYTTVNNYNSEGSDPEDPNEPETPGGTTPPWTGSNSGTLTPDGNGGYDLSLPDLTLPDLDIDWSINGLKDKFPFSIPWDLMAFFTVLNADAETPAIEGRINLGIVNWDIDWDLHDFDGLAALLRNLEFIGFCIALILITRNIIKG